MLADWRAVKTADLWVVYSVGRTAAWKAETRAGKKEQTLAEKLATMMAAS